MSMAIPRPLKLAITTLSPVHIGCDEVFEPTNFVIENGLLHRLDPADIAATLDSKEKSQLMRLAGEKDPIGPIQQFFKARRTRLAAVASGYTDIAAGIAREYEEKAGQPQQRGGGGNPVYNLFPMARTAYNPLDGKPYLPGSSLKGSMRTAWLSHLNKGQPPQEQGKRASAMLQERLLGYQAGQFNNDPFRNVAVVDAHPQEDRPAPPTRIVYAVSKKKRPSERGSPELKVFLETVREAMPEAFAGELRLTGKIAWSSLCDACNAFYRPQLEAELDHPQFQPLLDPAWRTLISTLLTDELSELMAARQGFLLRVGRHSGAESVTLDGVRSIKILGAKGEPPSYRPATTEKRFVSATRGASAGLLPFGWVWIGSCDDAHQHLAIALHDKIARYSLPIREAQADQLAAFETRMEKRGEMQREALARQAEAIAAEQAAAAAQAKRETERASMSANRLQIENLKEFFTERADQLGKNQEALNGNIHSRARLLASAALEGADWTAEEKAVLAALIGDWLPRLVARMDKDQLKKLKLATLRGS